MDVFLVTKGNSPNADWPRDVVFWRSSVRLFTHSLTVFFLRPTNQISSDVRYSMLYFQGFFSFPVYTSLWMAFVILQ